VLAERAEEAFVACDAAAFLNEVLSAMFEGLIQRAQEIARRGPDGHDWCATALAGGDRLLRALSSASSAEAWQWFRGGCDASYDGQRMITAPRGERALLAVLLAIGDESVQIEGGIENVRVVTPGAYVEVAVSTENLLPDQVLRQQRDRYQRQRGRYADADKKVLVCCDGQAGRMPGPGAVQDVGGDDVDLRDIADGADSFQQLDLVDLDRLQAIAA